MKKLSLKILSFFLIGMLLASESRAVVTFKIDSLTALSGSQVLVPVRVSDFNDIIGCQGTIQFDQTVIAYNSISVFGLPGMTQSSFGVGQAFTNGRIAYLWDDPSLSGVSIADDSVIFVIRFDVVGSSGELSSLCFTGSISALEVIDLSFSAVPADYVCGNVQIPGGSNPVANISKNDVSCFGADDGSASVSVSGGSPPYIYNWSNGGTTQTISGLSPDTYTVTVTDDDGLTTTASITVDEPALLTVSTTASAVTACGGSDGSATAIVSGGTTPYSYLWTSGSLTPTANNLAAGIYFVTVSDANSCSAVASADVEQPSSVSAQVTVTQDVTCHGGNDGSASVTASGGTGPYNYAWSGGGISATKDNLAAGSVSVTVTDANSCSAVGTANVSQPDELALSLSVTDASAAGTSDGAIDLSATGGTPPYSYDWSNGENTQDISGLSIDEYSVIVTDDNGCEASDTAWVGGPVSILDIKESSSIQIFPNPNNGSFEFSIAGNETFTRVELLNQLGQTVYAADLGAANVAGDKILLQTGLSNGTYIIRLSGNNTAQRSAAVIVNE